MSQWTDQWRNFVRETSYMHNLKEEKISNDQYWRIYCDHDQVLEHKKYPGRFWRGYAPPFLQEQRCLTSNPGKGAFALSSLLEREGRTWEAFFVERLCST